jgi:hypothetical protein
MLPKSLASWPSEYDFDAESSQRSSRSLSRVNTPTPTDANQPTTTTTTTTTTTIDSIVSLEALVKIYMLLISFHLNFDNIYRMRL